MKKTTLKIILVVLSLNSLVLANSHKHMEMKDENPIYHVNPMPNFMMAIHMMKSELSLSDEQKNEIKVWQAKSKPIMNKLKKDTVLAEKKLREMALNIASVSDLKNQYGLISKLREQIAVQKIMCRENMQNFLSSNQVTKIKEFYKKEILKNHK